MYISTTSPQSQQRRQLRVQTVRLGADQLAHHVRRDDPLGRRHHQPDHPGLRHPQVHADRRHRSSVRLQQHEVCHVADLRRGHLLRRRRPVAVPRLRWPGERDAGGRLLLGVLDPRRLADLGGRHAGDGAELDPAQCGQGEHVVRRLRAARRGSVRERGAVRGLGGAAQCGGGRRHDCAVVRPELVGAGRRRLAAGRRHPGVGRLVHHTLELERAGGPVDTDRAAGPHQSGAGERRDDPGDTRCEGHGHGQLAGAVQGGFEGDLSVSAQ